MLLRPVRVYKRLYLEAGGAQDAVWLRAEDGQPLLVTQKRQGGRVLLLATAIDPSWTNLPAKPLFVPLIHETLRGVLGETGDGGGPVVAICGDQPVLGRAWQGADRLVLTDQHPRPVQIDLRPKEGSLQPISAMEVPGIYGAAGSSQISRLLAVNPDAAGGDTRQMPRQQLEKWLTAVGDWSWLDPADPSTALSVEPSRTDLSWPLLWAVLALIVTETALSRWFSHAPLVVSTATGQDTGGSGAPIGIGTRGAA